MIKSLKTYRSVLIATTIALVCTITGCNTSKKAYTGGLDTITNSQASTNELFTRLVESYSGWSDLYVPVQLSLESPKQMSISGRATMVYGKEIYISLRMIGMEVAIVYLNEDEVYVIDKFHKYYFTERLEKLLKDTDLTITDIQDLLLGRAVMPGQGALRLDDVDRFSYLSSDDQWIMTPLKQPKGVDWHYLASATEPPLLNALSLRVNKDYVVEWRFEGATKTDAGIVDGVSKITIPYNDQDITLSITWMLDDARWNTGREVKFAAPSSSYKRLDIESLLKSVDKM